MKPQITFVKYLSLAILAGFLLISPSHLEAQKSMSTSIKNGTVTIKYDKGSTKYKIEYEGEITLSDDDKDVVAISRGGFLEISKSAFGSRRRIIIEANKDGQLYKDYYVGRSKQAWAPDGKAWLAEILPDVVRTTTMGAEARVERFYSKGGTNAVLGEVRQLKGDYVRSAYLEILLEKDLAPNSLAEVLKTAGKVIDSDHYLSKIMRSNQSAFLANETTTSAYIEATQSIQSDHYLSNVLKDAIKNGSISDTQMNNLLAATSTIQSDHYMSEVLKTVLDRRKSSPENLDRLISLSGNIDSDHYKSEVLRQALRKHDLSSNTADQLLNTMRDIGSDHYQSELVKELLDQQLSSDNLAKLLDLMSQSIDSDHYIHNVLKKTMDRHELKGASMDAFIRAMNTVGSDHYKTEVIKSLSNKNSLSDDQINKILNALTSINSGHYLSTCLVALSGRVNRGGDNLKETYRQVAKKISSETYYGKAMRALN